MTAARTVDTVLAPPFPWWGKKGKVAAEVWARFGNPTNYVEPFMGSAAVLLARPDHHQWWNRIETINDADCNLANVFRALAAEPRIVADHASAPVNEADLTARHLWLVQNRERLTHALMSDPTFYDARAAGWWLYGICAWVGGDWCTGIGPHTGSDALPISRGGTAPGVYRKMPMTSGGHGGKGIHRPRPATGQVRSLSAADAVPNVTASAHAAVLADFTALANRLRRVRVVCGDWTRVLREVARAPRGHYTGILLDPPYDPIERRGDLYGVGDRPEDRTDHVSIAARTWAIEHGGDPAYRIAYCSYLTDEEDDLFRAAGWSAYRWTASGGYGLRSTNRARDNRAREVVWFSPTCEPTTSAPPAASESAAPAEHHQAQAGLFAAPLAAPSAPVDGEPR